MSGDNTVFDLIIGTILAILGWLLQRVWSGKPSYKEMEKSIQDAIDRFHILDLEQDKLRLEPIIQMLSLLEKRTEMMHTENSEQLRDLREDIKRLLIVVGSRPTFAKDDILR